MTPRDYVMARLAAARAQLSDCDSQIAEAIDHYVDPDDDRDGVERANLIEGVEATLRDVAYILELARHAHAELSGEDLLAAELDDEGEGDEGGGEDGEE